MTRRARFVVCCVGLLSMAYGHLSAADLTLSPEAQSDVAELEAMITSRDTEEYEVGFVPLALDRILLTDRLGNPHLYHYLAFRVRNEIALSREAEASETPRYNEILKAMSDEYAYATVEGGVALDVHGQKVLDRADKRSKTRNLNITVLAYDENGSAIDLLDEPIGSGPQKELNIPDYGEYLAGSMLDQVRDKAEEQLGRKLLTLNEIRAKALPPYDPTQTDPETFSSVGEVYGVVVFNYLSNYGDEWTIEMRGLSNKMRVRLPDIEAAKVENYANTRVLRRVYTLTYSRPGDEYYRDQDRFTLTSQGWRWTDTFQRLQIRADMAYVRYFSDNLVNETGRLEPQTESEFWQYYDKVRAQKPNADAKQLPDFQKDLQSR